MKILESLGQRLQRLRVAASMTQGQLAQAARVPVKSLQNWEIGHREPGFRAACRLAKALGVTAEVLADTLPKEQAGKIVRAAGPTSKPKAAALAVKQERARPRKNGEH